MALTFFALFWTFMANKRKAFSFLKILMLYMKQRFRIDSSFVFEARPSFQSALLDVNDSPNPQDTQCSSRFGL